MLLLPMLFLLADDTESLQAMFDAACADHHKVPLATGVYNISAPIVTKCALSVTGEGADRSIIIQTAQRNLNHAIIAPYPLAIQDLAIRTEPLHKDLGMVAVYRNDVRSDETGPALGQDFSFVRFHSSGFNFAIDIAGTSDTDMLGKRRGARLQTFRVHGAGRGREPCERP